MKCDGDTRPGDRRNLDEISVVTDVALVVVGEFAPARARAQVRHEIEFPDLPGYQTLLCDLHTHTVFSDGTVWPTVRVDEAWRLGLDVLSITDHIEYKPFGNDVSTDHNRPYELAIGRARERNLLLPRGAEITRDTPPGHFNAVFLDDVNPLELTYRAVNYWIAPETGLPVTLTVPGEAGYLR